ncbi:MAG: LuxR C-terminal-related transcriptional regulator [Planctomycetota bacterium]
MKAMHEGTPAATIEARPLGLGGAFRVAWELASIPPVPIAAIGDRIAHALASAASGSVAAVQIGTRRDGEWSCLSSGWARSGGSLQGGGPGRLTQLPWLRGFEAVNAGEPCFAEPDAGEPALWPVAAAMRGEEREIDLAAVVAYADAPALVLTAQFALGARVVAASSHVPLLRQALPWAARIAAEALDWPRDPCWLSAREAEVLDQLVLGRSVNDIADRIERSPYTVHDHVKALHRKLGVHCRGALVARAIRSVPPPGL